MPKILIVDDSETLRDQVRPILRARGYIVVEGSDGNEGLRTLQDNPDVRLILCDMNMPNMDGLTMCKRIQENPTWSKVPIMMLTTEANPEMKSLGKAAGVVAWILKPFSEEKLAGAIKKLLGE